MNKEIWKDIPEYEGLYQASNFGRIRSLDREVIQWNRFDNVKVIYKGKILSLGINGRGYLHCRLTKDGNSKTKLVHRLVAMAFLEDFNENLTVDHIDCNKLNNMVDNLRMVTIKKNIQLSYENHLHNLTKVGKYDLQDNLLEIYESCSDASRKNNCSPALISDCCNPNKCNKTGRGYKWKYIKEENNE